MLASLCLSPEGKSVTDWQGKVYDISKSFPLGGDLEEAAIWYNDGSTSLTTGVVIYPDGFDKLTTGEVRLNCYYYYYYRHYYRGSHSTELRAGSGLSSLIGLKCLMKDIEMIFATVLGKKIQYAGEEI